jgi:hypothetical protein
MSENPEQHVMDDIDELMAQACDEHGVPLDDYNRDRYVKCELCQEDWHGLPYGGCPGANATDDQRKRWVAAHSERRYIGHTACVYEGELCTVHLYVDGRGGYVGLLTPSEPDESPVGAYTFDTDRACLDVEIVPNAVSLPTTFVPQWISTPEPDSDTP